MSAPNRVEPPRQPFLNDSTVVLRAPTQAWSAPSGTMGERPIHGIYVSDVRIVSSLSIDYDGEPAETIATELHGADTVQFIAVVRQLDNATADPRVRSIHRRAIDGSGVTETITLTSRLAHDVSTEIRVRLGSDLADMDAIKSGLETDAAEIVVKDRIGRWGRNSIAVELRAPNAHLAVDDDFGLELTWRVTVPSGGDVAVSWRIAAVDASAVVRGADGPADWKTPEPSGDDRLDRWLARATVDLEALRMSTVADPASVFLAAGAPWFFTLFGRDSIWAARLLLPLGGRLAGDTLRVLAGMQGGRVDETTAEQPGKIMHELRRQTARFPGENLTLPPLYYGTIDATALWVCLLYDAWRWGMPDAEVEPLLPNLEAALAWLRDYGDADGDGLLEYAGSTGSGLANQGWKDSGDSVQWRDGALAEGPIALCEVQGYAYEAARHGAALLTHFGRPADAWQRWASALRDRFHQEFWIKDAAGAYPAIALDANKRPVDTLTSNIGHLLGTGLLGGEQSELVARRLVSPQLSSGYGLRTMSTDSRGYWPLSYHGGSVWAHDTAIAIRGLTAAGFRDAAAELSEGLLAAAASFDYRMPELHSGDASSAFSQAIPYPAACRPQAWSAAAAVGVYASILGLTPPARPTR